MQENIIYVITGKLSDIGNMFAQLEKDIKDQINNWLGFTDMTLHDWLTYMWGDITDGFESVSKTLDGIMQHVTDKVKEVTNKVQTVYYTLQSQITSVWDSITTQIESIMMNIKSAVGNIGEWIDAQTEKIKTIITDLQSNITNWIQEKITLLKSFISETLDKVISYVKSLWDWIKDKFNETIELLKTKFAQVKEWIYEKTRELIDYITLKIDQAQESITAHIKSLEVLFSTLAEDMVRFFQDLWLEFREWIDDKLTVNPEQIANAVKLINDTIIQESQNAKMFNLKQQFAQKG